MTEIKETAVQTSDSATIECDAMPVERLRPLANSLGLVLPWHDEEEAPPCIGERYRDALRPRPRDD